MKKKFLALFMSFVMLSTLAVPTYAEDVSGGSNVSVSESSDNDNDGGSDSGSDSSSDSSSNESVSSNESSGSDESDNSNVSGDSIESSGSNVSNNDVAAGTDTDEPEDEKDDIIEIIGGAISSTITNVTNKVTGVVKYSKHSAYKDLKGADTVDEMYEVLQSYILDNNEDELQKLSKDELIDLYQKAYNMNLENPPADPDYYTDLMDTLQYLAGEFDLNGALVLAANELPPSGNISGNYVLKKDLTLTGALKVAKNTSATIDLNGYVLNANANANNTGFIGLISGTLTIIDSNPNRSHYGTVNSDGIWVYKADATSGTEIKGGIITGGKGDRGGAFHVNGNGKLILNGGTIAGCEAKDGEADDFFSIHYPTGGAGGAVFLQASSADAGTFEMNGGAIKYCAADTTTDKRSLGGAVFIDAEGDKNGSKAGTFIMNGGSIEHCRAKQGGAVFVHREYETAKDEKGYDIKAKPKKNGVTATFTMTGGTISNCVVTGATVTELKSSKNNTDTNKVEYKAHGGAVYSNGTFTMTGGTISHNETRRDADTATGIVDGVHKYYGYGGGVYIDEESSVFTMKGGTISNNIAASGGGVMVWEHATFTMNDGTISKNRAQGYGGIGNGGAVYVQGATFNFNKGTMSENWARRYGGAININQTANLNLSGECVIQNNSANHGGGISQEAGDCAITLASEGILISGNTARTVATADGSGGGGAGKGGGLFIEKGTLDYSAGTISSNHATGRGGGLAMNVERITGDITFNMTGGLVQNNTTDGTGGGIDIFSDTSQFVPNSTTTNHVKVYLNGGTIDNNASKLNGGGAQVCVNKDNSEAYMYIGTAGSETPTITDNESKTAYGGAASISSGSIVMNKGVVSGNIAVNGGAFNVTGGSFTMNGGSVTSNKATANGGAVCVNATANTAAFTMQNGEISDNTADRGGALYIASGNVFIEHGVINSNEAKYGGAVYLNGTGDVTPRLEMQSGEMSGNIAKRTNNSGGDGGAILATKGVLEIGLKDCPGSKADPHYTYHRKDKNTYKHHPILTDNVAQHWGGAISISNPDNKNEKVDDDDGIVRFYCGDAVDNEAANSGLGKNVFMYGGTFVFYNGTNVGRTSAPELVIIGGYLKNESSINYIDLNYYQDNNAGVDQTFKGYAEANKEMNLPDAEEFWNKSGYSFVGWSTEKIDSTHSGVRDKNDYKPSGTAIKIVDEYDGKIDDAINLYAVWVPHEHSISIADGLSVNTINSNVKKYTYDNLADTSIRIPADLAPSHPGFNVVGWYLYQNLDTNGNWCDETANGDFISYEPVYKTELKQIGNLNFAAKTTGKLTVQNTKMKYYALENPNDDFVLNIPKMTFGNITIVADYELAYGDLEIKKQGINVLDIDQTCIFDVSSVTFAATTFEGMSEYGANKLTELPTKIDLDILFHNNETVTIKHLPYGTYKVDEQQDWSWRYKDWSKDNVGVNAPNNKLTVTNEREKIQWMDGNAYCQNICSGSDSSNNAISLFSRIKAFKSKLKY